MEMLFPIEPQYPKGFSYYPDFLSLSEEEELIQKIKEHQLHTFNFHGYEAKRKVASFGFDYSFENKSLSKGKSIPAAFDPLIEKVSGKSGVRKEDFSELLLTEYPIGAVINWHRDAPPFDIIAGISLRSDCVFKLRPFDKAKQGRRSVISIPVKRRSLYIIKDAARTDWEHSIAPVNDGRYSITLRTLRGE
jgi:alkylated DNA repair dioxygenase AlkB